MRGRVGSTDPCDAQLAWSEIFLATQHRIVALVSCHYSTAAESNTKGFRWRRVTISMGRYGGIVCGVVAGLGAFEMKFCPSDDSWLRSQKKSSRLEY